MLDACCLLNLLDGNIPPIPRSWGTRYGPVQQSPSRARRSEPIVMSWYLAQRSGPCAVFHRTKIQLPTGSHCTAPYVCFPSSSCMALYCIYCIYCIYIGLSTLAIPLVGLGGLGGGRVAPRRSSRHKYHPFRMQRAASCATHHAVVSFGTLLTIIGLFL